MSDVMLFGVLRMPLDMAMSDELSRYQYWKRGQEAADRIEHLEAQNKELREALERADNHLLFHRVIRAHGEIKQALAALSAADAKGEKNADSDDDDDDTWAGDNLLGASG